MPTITQSSPPATTTAIIRTNVDSRCLPTSEVCVPHKKKKLSGFASPSPLPTLGKFNSAGTKAVTATATVVYPKWAFSFRVLAGSLSGERPHPAVAVAV
jgi:hypothetical protein